MDDYQLKRINEDMRNEDIPSHVLEEARTLKTISPSLQEGFKNAVMEYVYNSRRYYPFEPTSVIDLRNGKKILRYGEFDYELEQQGAFERSKNKVYVVEVNTDTGLKEAEYYLSSDSYGEHKNGPVVTYDKEGRLSTFAFATIVAGSDEELTSDVCVFSIDGKLVEIRDGDFQNQLVLEFNEKELSLSDKVRSIIERDASVTQGEANLLKDAIHQGVLPEIVALAFQFRHNEVLIFKDRKTLEETVVKYYGKRLSAEEILFSEKRMDHFEKMTGRTVNQTLSLFCYGEDSYMKEQQINRTKLRDYIDRILSNAKGMDVFELEAAFRTYQHAVLELGYIQNPSTKETQQLQLLRVHLDRARKELVTWSRRNYRTTNTRLDKILNIEFHPTYKLPDKRLLKTREGRDYIKGLKKGNNRMTSQGKTRFKLATAQFIMLSMIRNNEICYEKSNVLPKYLTEESCQLKRDLNWFEGKPIDKGFMRLSELRFNIQDGENRIVPGMSKQLIDASQRLTDNLVSENNPKNINPIGKNPLTQEKMERIKNDQKRQNKHLMKNIIGSTSHKRSGGIRKKNS